MTTRAPDAEPACPTTVASPQEQPTPNRTDLRVEACAFDAIPRAAWDALAARNPWSTPFSSWAFHRAWWDAYGANAHDQTLIVRGPGTSDAVSGDAVAIVPLMHRHAVEPTDADNASKIRHADENRITTVEPTAKVVFFGASYHADYATVLGAPDDLPGVADAVARHLADPDAGHPGHPEPWDAIDLRRLRCGDPAGDALADAFRSRGRAEAWTVDVEREDVCPVVRLPEGGDFDAYLSGLDKKARHEIRRKLRRAEAAGELRLTRSPDPLADLETFIELHQSKWGADGLFPPTAGGDASRVFLRRLFEEVGPDGPVELSFLTAGDRRIGSGIFVEDGDRLMFYNAGIDPAAYDLSPGVVLAAEGIRSAIERGMRRFDFLRGNERYKYEWGSVDEPIQRILVRRSATAVVG